MQKKTNTIVAVVAVSLGVVACENMNTVFRKHSLDRSDSFITDAKQRVVVNTRGNVANGRNNPQRIICAEPSPDVAQAISTALSGAIEADAARTSNIRESGTAEASRTQNASGSAAIAASMTEGVVQLGERLATIQLLRDGFYRACESYANGAISDTMYSLIVGNIDDVMVALLTSEMAAGAFGRQLAGIGGRASATAGQMAADQTALNGIIDNIATTQNTLTNNDALISGLLAKETRNEAEEKNLIALTAARPGLVKSLADLQKAKNVAEQAFAKTYVAALVQPGGGITNKPNAEGVKAIAQIYKSFSQRDSMGSLVAACVAALDRSPNNSGRHPETNRHVQTTQMVATDGSVQPFPNSNQYGTELTHVCKHLFHPKHGGGALVDMFKAKLRHTERMAVIERAGVLKDLQNLYDQQCVSSTGVVQTELCKNLKKIVG